MQNQIQFFSKERIRFNSALSKEMIRTYYAKRKFLEDRGGREDCNEVYASYGEYGPELTTKIFEKFAFAALRSKNAPYG